QGGADLVEDAAAPQVGAQDHNRLVVGQLAVADGEGAGVVDAAARGRLAVRVGHAGERHRFAREVVEDSAGVAAADGEAVGPRAVAWVVGSWVSGGCGGQTATVGPLGLWPKTLVPPVGGAAVAARSEPAPLSWWLWTGRVLGPVRSFRGSSRSSADRRDART